MAALFAVAGLGVALIAPSGASAAACQARGVTLGSFSTPIANPANSPCIGDQHAVARVLSKGPALPGSLYGVQVHTCQPLVLDFFGLCFALSTRDATANTVNANFLWLTPPGGAPPVLLTAKSLSAHTTARGTSALNCVKASDGQVVDLNVEGNPVNQNRPVNDVHNVGGLVVTINYVEETPTAIKRAALRVEAPGTLMPLELATARSSCTV